MKIYEFTEGNLPHSFIETIKEWEETYNASLFDLDTDCEKMGRGILNMVRSPNSAVLVLEDSTTGDIVGFMGIIQSKNEEFESKFAMEHFWYVRSSHRGISSIKMLHHAKEWAKKKGCSRFLATASFLASDLHGQVCDIYEAVGMKPFETIYIGEV
ncbi:MAG: GNAT family N-acetyltransferase [Desulfobacteraceae bacterium]|nr:GNAT family N-acetyltransferase [Desulfobacteraceae bacterium]